MAWGGAIISIYNKTGTSIVTNNSGNTTTSIYEQYATVNDLLENYTNAGITSISSTIGGTPISGDTTLRTIAEGMIYFYDVTPAKTVTGFFLDGTEYKIGGDIAWGNISGTLSDQTDLNTALSGKQNTLATQTAYTSKGTASKVPQITTNSLGQVTGITEVNISYPSQVSDEAFSSSWDGVTGIAPSKNAVYDKISVMDTTISGKADATDVNTKTFEILDTTDTAILQDAINWYVAGKMPLVKHRSGTFILSSFQYTYDGQLNAHAIFTSVSTVNNGDLIRFRLNIDCVGTTISTVTETQETLISNTAYASSWDGVTGIAPTKDAVYDKISTMDTTISGKQDALTAQTAYTSKGTSSKVPQITTNSLGQVTGITEVDISYPSQIDNTAYGSSWNGVTNKAPTKDAVYDKINAMDGQISDLQAHGKFLSLWNSATGLPISFPLTIPYAYSTGDYYMVETLPSSGNKYMPNGSSYSGTASTTVDSINEVKVGDMYIYDGSVWLYASNHGKDVAFSNIAGNPSDNTNLATALNGKQDTLTTQTAYTSKGSATKVPQITTNSLGQVTGITEVNIQAGDMLYSDFNWQTKTGATFTLDLASTITPSANFTVNAPATLKDGQTYILRVNNGATAYTMTLGTGITNPFDTSLALTANGVDQFVFLAIGGDLELQPEIEGGNEGVVRISNQANNILANGGKLWAGTQANYEALGTYDNNTVYLTI